MQTSPQIGLLPLHPCTIPYRRQHHFRRCTWNVALKRVKLKLSWEFNGLKQCNSINNICKTYKKHTCFSGHGYEPDCICPPFLSGLPQGLRGSCLPSFIVIRWGFIRFCDQWVTMYVHIDYYVNLSFLCFHYGIVYYFKINLMHDRFVTTILLMFTTHCRWSVLPKLPKCERS